MSRPARIWVTSLLLLAGGLAAAEDPAALSLEHLRAANQARGQLAREESAWTAERERLRALVAATAGENTRLERQATGAEAAREASAAKLQALRAGSDLDALRQRLAAAAARLASGLQALAPSQLPGVIVLTSGPEAFDAAVRALDLAERAAGSVAIEVVLGERSGRREAVRLLRVGGAAAWWAAVDPASTAAGTARWDGKGLVLIDADSADAAAIRNAFAQVDGQAPAGVSLLPLGEQR